MFRRRLAASAGVLSLLACAATIVLVSIGRDRVAQARLSMDARSRAVSHRFDEVERESKAYDEKIGTRPSAAELTHSNALGKESNRLVAEMNNITALMLSPPVPPPAYSRAIIFSAALAAAFLLCWAWLRLRHAFPRLPNLLNDERNKIMHEVQLHSVRHWQLYARLAVSFALIVGIWYGQKLLWPQADHGVVGGLIELAAVSFATVIAFAIFTPALSRDFRRELAAQALCPRCGYDQRATPAHCPECNWRVPEVERDPYGASVIGAGRPR